MECVDYPLKFIGQSWGVSSTRYEEHIQAIRNNNSSSIFSNHILNTGHTYGTLMDTMDITMIGKKGKYVNNLEKYCIYITLF
jgi:hypothetical protein